MSCKNNRPCNEQEIIWTVRDKLAILIPNFRTKQSEATIFDKNKTKRTRILTVER